MLVTFIGFTIEMRIAVVYSSLNNVKPQFVTSISVPSRRGNCSKPFCVKSFIKITNVKM